MSNYPAGSNGENPNEMSYEEQDAEYEAEKQAEELSISLHRFGRMMNDLGPAGRKSVIDILVGNKPINRSVPSNPATRATGSI